MSDFNKVVRTGRMQNFAAPGFVMPKVGLSFFLPEEPKTVSPDGKVRTWNLYQGAPTGIRWQVMKKLLGDIGQELETLPRPVHWWMWWFNLLFLIGVIFAIWHVPARWAVVAHMLCFPFGIAVYHYTREIGLMGAPHIVFWTPLLIYIPLVASNSADFVLFSPYGVWVIALLVTIAVSVLFDLRAVLAYLSQRHRNNQRKKTPGQ